MTSHFRETMTSTVSPSAKQANRRVCIIMALRFFNTLPHSCLSGFLDKPLFISKIRELQEIWGEEVLEKHD